MAVAQDSAGPDGADSALDRLEAALETISRRLDTPKPAQAGSEVLDEIEQRLDVVIEHVKAALGRKSDQ